MTEVLTQEEINQLLTAIRNGDTEPDDFVPVAETRKVKIYNFKRPDKFTKEQIRSISIIHETFARELSAALTNYLIKDVHVRVASVDQLTYEEFIHAVPTPTTLVILNSELKGRVILEIDPAISHAIINRLFGGNGEVKEQHELTALEIKVMEDVINSCALQPLQNAWKKVISLNPAIEQIDTNPQFCRIAPPREMIVLVTFECTAGEVGGMINFCIPYPAIVPVLGRLNAQYWYSGVEPQKEKIMKTPLNEALGEVQIPITVQLGKAVKQLKDIKKIEKGTIIELDALAGEPCAVYAGGVLIGRGEVVVIDENFGIRITEITGGGNG
jgi:flagellar motor switch protein FliM